MEVEISNPWVLDYGFGWRWKWRWLGLVGEVGFFWVSVGGGGAVVVEIGEVMEIGVGLGFVFIGLVVGGVFLGFCKGGWSVVEVEIGVAMFVFWGWRCLGEFGFAFVGFFFFFLCGFVYLFLGFIGFYLLEVYGFDFLDLLGLIY